MRGRGARRLDAVPADLVHLVRHGEVFNPDRVLYGRIPGFGTLSELGHRMAALAPRVPDGPHRDRDLREPAAAHQESAAPWASSVRTRRRDRRAPHRAAQPVRGRERRRGLRDPAQLALPRAARGEPTWGEPLPPSRKRMMAAVAQAYADADGGEVVLVSHQLPIWMVARTVQRQAARARPAQPPLHALEHHHARLEGRRLRRGGLSGTCGRVAGAVHRSGSRVKTRSTHARRLGVRFVALVVALRAAPRRLHHRLRPPRRPATSRATTRRLRLGRRRVVQPPAAERDDPVAFEGRSTTGDACRATTMLGKVVRRQLLVRQMPALPRRGARPRVAARPVRRRRGRRSSAST